jgi:aryl-alcohol dehydrogenase
VVGIPPAGTTMPGDLTNVLTYGQTVRGIIEGDSDPDVFIPRMIELWREGRLPVERLVKTFPFDEINSAIAAQHHGECVKVVLMLP